MFEGIFTTKRQALYIAEIGINHNGDMDMAKKLIEYAAEAGADGVKFQVFVPELMNSVYTTDLLGKGSENNPDTGIIDFFSRFVFTGDQYRELKSFADDNGVIFFASVFDKPSLDLMTGCDVPLLKLASSELTNHPLIKAAAETGKPMILSTGMSREEEIAAAVELFHSRSAAELVLMHCVSLYPLPPAEANIGRIQSLKERFNLNVGFSDHTSEVIAPVLAAAQGARIFEKHFTIDKQYDCPDKQVSLTPADFKRMITSVEMAITMIGEGDIAFGSAEAETARASRRSLFARNDIPAGKAIEYADLIAKRPGVGIPIFEINSVVGRICSVDIRKDHIIKREYLT